MSTTFTIFMIYGWYWSATWTPILNLNTFTARFALFFNFVAFSKLDTFTIFMIYENWSATWTPILNFNTFITRLALFFTFIGIFTLSTFIIYSWVWSAAWTPYWVVWALGFVARTLSLTFDVLKAKLYWKLKIYSKSMIHSSNFCPLLTDTDIGLVYILVVF